MRRILLAWEIGASLGHVARLTPLARRLQRRGDHVDLAVRDPRALLAATARSPMAGHAAPHLHADLRARPASLNYADTLMRNGYHDALAVRRLIEEWTELIDDVRPDLVVLEHAPGALLAASLRGLPRIVIGSGFSVPPLTTPQPTIQPWFDVSSESLDQRERALLAAINPAIAGLGGSPLDRVAGIFDGADRAICTWPELDHYQGRSDDAFIGPISGVEGDEVPWPEGVGPRVFLYGRGPRLMDALGIAISRECRLVMCRPSADPPPDLPPHVTWLRAPADVEPLAATADLVVCEAPGTATQFLLHGVPALLLPTQLEQELWAYRVAGKGLVRSVGLFARAGARDLADAFDEALTSAVRRSRAGAFAVAYGTSGRPGALTRLTDRCDALLA